VHVVARAVGAEVVPRDGRVVLDEVVPAQYGPCIE
jgi:hypothetical protein